MDLHDDNRECIEKIEYVRGLYEVQKYKVESEEYIKDLLFKDYVRTVKRNVSRYDVLNLFEKAQLEIGKKTKKERATLETLQNWMSEDFLNGDKNFKITHITSCGWDRYAWSIEFEGYGKNFVIVMPVMKNLTTENFKYANEGMFAFSIRENEVIWCQLRRSYNIKDIADYIKECFANIKTVSEE